MSATRAAGFGDEVSAGSCWEPYALSSGTTTRTTAKLQKVRTLIAATLLRSV